MPNSNFQMNEGLVMSAQDRGQDRMYVEQEKIRKYFPQFSLTALSGRITGAKGWLKTNVGNQHVVRIVLPGDYPYSMPAIALEDWQPTGPHLYSNGTLCVMKPDQWRSHFTLAFMVAKTAIWLNKHEVWKSTGRWPGKEQQHGFVPELIGFFEDLFS